MIIMKTTDLQSNYSSSMEDKDIVLSDDLFQLGEQIARHVHDEWMRKRLAEGWTLGPERSDERKQHPCLIPYDELPEIEKEYDRGTALTTIKTLMALGWRIEKIS